mgnify:CR=1 FL=1
MWRFPLPSLHFNPRSPHGERRRRSRDGASVLTFQPTLPARGATSVCVRCCVPACNFNPRSPHGERPLHAGGRRAGHGDFNPRSPHGERRAERLRHHGNQGISTHAPRTGSDTALSTASRVRLTFQPTLPARGATIKRVETALAKRFQPTLPARGATSAPRQGKRHAPYFNPRSPHGERH